MECRCLSYLAALPEEEITGRDRCKRFDLLHIPQQQLSGTASESIADWIARRQFPAVRTHQPRGRANCSKDGFAKGGQEGRTPPSHGLGLVAVPPPPVTVAGPPYERNEGTICCRKVYSVPPQRYSCDMVPPLSSSGLLQPGIHWATWAEVEERFASTEWRRTLLDGVRRAVESLKEAGCRTLYLDGSFVTSKNHPGDFDGCWDPDGVDARKLDPVLLTFGNRRAAQKAKYHGELFISSSPADGGLTFLDFFQRDKATGHPKGIIGIDLEDFP